MIARAALAAVLGVFPAEPERDEAPPALEWIRGDAELRPRALAQADAEADRDGTGARLRRARAGLDARAGSVALVLAGGWEGDRGPELLDARLIVDRLDFATLAVGKGKVAFGRSNLTPEPYLQFPERPRALAAVRDGGLVPDRRAGVVLGGDLGLLAYAAGAYAGGEDALPGAEQDGWLAAGRVELRPIGPVGVGEADASPGDPWYRRPRLAFGASGYAHDTREVRRRAIGADALFKMSGLSAGVEVVAGRVEDVPAGAPPATRRPMGVAGQAGWFVLPGLWEVAARAEADRDGADVAGATTLLGWEGRARAQLAVHRRDRLVLVRLEGRL